MNEDIISNQKFQSRFSNGDVINQSIEENGIASSYQILLKNTLWNLQLQKDLLVKVFKIVDNIEYKLFEGNLSEFLDYMNSDYSEQILVESILNEEGENNMENVENMTPEQNGISSMLSDMIVDEWETIDKYNSVIASLPKTGEYEDIKNVINDIIKEEYMHVGQLESAIKTVDDIADHIEKGEMEGDLQLDESVEESAKFILDESLFEE